MSDSKYGSRKRMRTGKRPYSTDQKTYQMVKAVVNNSIETKHHSADFTNIGVSANGPLIYAASDLSQGAGEAQRLGSQITMTSFKYDFFFSMPNVAPDVYNNLRMIIYIPRDTKTLILANTGFNHQVDWDKFHILKDMFIPLAGPNGSGTVRRQGWIKFPRGKKVQFDGPDGNDVVRNRLCFFITSDSQIPGHPVVNGYTRLFYKDA